MPAVLQAVPGGYAWRSDPKLRLPSSTRLPEAAIHSILADIMAPTVLILADPAPPYFPVAQQQARIASMREVRVTRLAGGHHVHMEDAETVARHLTGATTGSPALKA